MCQEKWIVKTRSHRRILALMVAAREPHSLNIQTQTPQPQTRRLAWVGIPEEIKVLREAGALGVTPHLQTHPQDLNMSRSADPGICQIPSWAFLIINPSNKVSVLPCTALPYLLPSFIPPILIFFLFHPDCLPFSLTLQLEKKGLLHIKRCGKKKDI